MRPQKIDLRLDRSVYIILGSNIGDKRSYIQQACSEIELVIGKIKKYSSFYQTSPWGFESDDEFLNMAICVSSNLDANNIMSILLEIETKLGRKRSTQEIGYQSRTIDLDILLIDDLIIHTELLIVPHPRMLDRKFVLIPLAEIAGKTLHPIEKLSIDKLLDICEDKENVIKVF